MSNEEEFVLKEKLVNVELILEQMYAIDRAANAENLAKEIPILLKILGEYTRADRSYIFELRVSSEPYYTNLFEWCAKGVVPQIDNLQCVFAKDMRYWHNELLNGGFIAINGLENIRELMPQEYKLLLPQHVDSVLVVPIYNKNHLFGFIGLDNPRMDKAPLFKHLLISIGGHLGSVYGNNRMLELLEEKQQDLEKNLHELQLAAEEARKANEAKTDFLSRMSHDIRTPMNAINGLTNIALRNFNDTDKVAECLNKIQQAGKTLQILVSDVLDLAQIEKGKLSIRPKRVSVDEIYSVLEANIRDLRAEKGVRFQFTKHDIIYNHLTVDSMRLTQICNKLLSNAFKYTMSGGLVTWEIYEEPACEPGKVRLVNVIEDTGIGMSQKYLNQMYDEFSRAVDTRINEVRGSGLGLSVVKKLVDLMHGKIEVESAKGLGTTFRISLVVPYITDEVIRREQEEERLRNKSFFKGRRILIAEDNKLNYEIEAEILAMHGMECVRAVNGSECVKLFTESAPETFDAILMDVQMPVLDGVDATIAIRNSAHAEAQTIPIIAVTANAFTEDILHCLDAGMNEHMAKPFDIAAMLNTLAKYMRKK